MFKLSQRRTGRCLKTWQNRVPHSLGGRKVWIKTKTPQINNKMLPNLKTTDKNLDFTPKNVICIIHTNELEIINYCAHVIRKRFRMRKCRTDLEGRSICSDAVKQALS